jgi:hypothetical protein
VGFFVMCGSVRLRAVVFSAVVAVAALTMLGLATAASALSLTMDGITLNADPFNRGKLAQAQTALANYRATHTISNLHVETFEGYAPWGVGGGTQNLTNTGVGSFTPFGNTGSGNSVVGGGSKLQVRNDNTMFWGRYNTYNTPPLPPGPVAGNWLDSNDNRGMKWQIDGLGQFNALAFFVIDAADVGGKFSIKVGDTMFRNLADGMRLKNGNIYFLRILLPDLVDNLTIRLSHNIHNDGFGIDGAIVGEIAPIPVPPAAALLVPALALLAGVGRRARARRA